MPATYSERVVDAELDDLLTGLPAIVLEGPKGVGKTATAARRASTIVRLDEPGPREIAAADPAALRPTAPPTHSVAARIVTVRMRPLAIGERGLAAPTISLAQLLTGARPAFEGETDVGLVDYAREIVSSGFPGVRHLTGRALRAQLDGYLERIVDRDFVEQGHRVRRPATLRRWLAAYAAATGTCASWETIRHAATSGDGEMPTKVTVNTYRDVLERLWIMESLPGWRPGRNHLARLTQAPKHHLADPALAARLLGMDEHALLDASPHGAAAENEITRAIPRDGTLLGALFESLVTLSVRVYAQAAEARVHHLRTKEGRHEVDLLVERGDRRVVGIETKLSASVTDHDVRHLLWLRDQLGADVLDLIVVTTGRYAYRRPDGVAVVPAALLGP